jgi:hypothetical protein
MMIQKQKTKNKKQKRIELLGGVEMGWAKWGVVSTDTASCAVTVGQPKGASLQLRCV